MNDQSKKMDVVLIEAAPVARDEGGAWWHPGMPDFEEGQEAEWKAWIAVQGLETVSGKLEDEDCDHPAYIAYFDDGEPCFLGWVDEPPAGEGWFTLAISDTEDGPVWSWARRVSPAEPTRIGATAIVFANVGTFEAARAAEQWLDDRGFSWGPSQVGGPQAIWHGDCAISKWRNLSAAEKRDCHATMDGEKREGPVTITLRAAATPEAIAAFALTEADIAGKSNTHPGDSND